MHYTKQKEINCNTYILGATLCCHFISYTLRKFRDAFLVWNKQETEHCEMRKLKSQYFRLE